MQIVNLTETTVPVRLKPRIPISYDPCGYVARIRMERGSAGAIADSTSHDVTHVIPHASLQPDEIEVCHPDRVSHPLPDPRDGVYYLVPRDVYVYAYAYMPRPDLVIPTGWAEDGVATALASIGERAGVAHGGAPASAVSARELIEGPDRQGPPRRRRPSRSQVASDGPHESR